MKLSFASLSLYLFKFVLLLCFNYLFLFTNMPLIFVFLSLIRLLYDLCFEMFFLRFFFVFRKVSFVSFFFILALSFLFERYSVCLDNCRQIYSCVCYASLSTLFTGN